MGEPGRKIGQRAAELNADLIVVGRRRRGLIDRLFSRSVSSAIVERAPGAVLVVPEDTAVRLPVRPTVHVHAADEVRAHTSGKSNDQAGLSRGAMKR
jgi:hypothetical protein